MRLVRSEIDATFVDVLGALEITQNNVTYRARKWQLTPELIDVIDTAIEFGYSAFWVRGHPSRPYLKGGERFEVGSHHITFARAHSDKWTFVVDGSAEPPIPKDITFNKGLRDFLERIGQGHSWEHSGGHNLRVLRHEFPSVLRQLDSETLDGLQGRSVPVQYFGTNPISDIYSETQLQDRLEARWAPIISSAGFQLQRRPIVDGPIPDIIIDAKENGIIVVELKYSHAGGVELDQLRKYVNLSGIRSRCVGRRLSGVLIARDFSREIIDEANSNVSTISLYAFAQESGQLYLKLIAGQEVLHQLQLRTR